MTLIGNDVCGPLTKPRKSQRVWPFDYNRMRIDKATINRLYAFSLRNKNVRNLKFRIAKQKSFGGIKIILLEVASTIKDGGWTCEVF